MNYRVELDPPVREAEHRGRRVVGYMTEGSRARLEWLIREFDIGSVIEVGSFCGLSACFFAERVDEVVCVDHFGLEGQRPHGRRNDPTEVYWEFIQNTIAYPNIRSVARSSLQAAELPIEADMVFIDAGHSREEVLADIRAWLPHARKLICGDDLQKHGVAEAVEAMGYPNSGERIWWQPV